MFLFCLPVLHLTYGAEADNLLVVQMIMFFKVAFRATSSQHFQRNF